MPDDTATTQLAWREDLRFAVDEDDAAAMIQAIPLAPRELAQVATHRAADLLTKLAKAHSEALVVLLSASGEWSALPLAAFLDDNDVERLISFATIVLPSHVGGLKDGLPDKTASSAVSDVVETNRYLRFRIDRKADGEWLGRELSADDDAKSSAAGSDAEEVCSELVAELRPQFKRVHLSGNSYGEDVGPRVVYFAKLGVPLDAPGTADIASLLRKDVPLNAHNDLAECFAKRLTEHLDLPKNLAEAVILAAALHDVGKDRPQWQSAIRNAGKPPLAKSARSGFDHHASGGYRHEFGSMLDAADYPAVRDHPERDLILHLIAAHHGHGRPGFAQTGYDCPRRLLRECEQMANEAEERYLALQRRFGWWQLAYLESLVKSADALASTEYNRDEAIGPVTAGVNR
jgi:CRISPR-associated endonuclease/helicase Cas3